MVDFLSPAVLLSCSSSLHYNKLRHRSRCGAESYPFTLGGDSDNNTSKTVLHLGGSTPNKEVEYTQVKKILLATAAAGFMALSIGVPAASATVTPSPTPTQQQFQHPPRVQLLPQQFEIARTDVGARDLNTVLARGPVRLTDGNDTVLGGNLFRHILDDRGVNSVNLRHSPLGLPQLYPGTCSAALLQTVGWTFNGGQGIYRNETGRGTAIVSLLASGHVRNFKSWSWNDGWNYSQNLNSNYSRNLRVCPLDGLTRAQVLAQIIRHLRGLPTVVQFDQVSLNVQGRGVASQPRLVRDPCQYQTDGPTLGAYHGDPTPAPRSTCYETAVPIESAA